MLLAAGLGLTSVAQAQNTKKFSIGFKVSPNFSWSKVVDGPMKSNGLGLGFSYGLSMDYNVLGSDNYWLNGDLMISTIPTKVQMSTDFKRDANNNKVYKDVTYDYALQYIQIPLSFKLKTDDIGGMRYYLNAGLGLSFLLGAQASAASGNGTDFYDGDGITHHDPNDTTTSKYDFVATGATKEYLDDINGSRVSMIIGAGGEYPVSANMKMVFGLKLDNGFTDIIKSDLVNARNNYLSLQLGLMF